MKIRFIRFFKTQTVILWRPAVYESAEVSPSDSGRRDISGRTGLAPWAWTHFLPGPSRPKDEHPAENYIEQRTKN